MPDAPLWNYAPKPVARTARGIRISKLVLPIRGDWSVKDTWVVYKKPRAVALRSADVVVICKRTGRVLYEGSADDEG
jgi:hypothetical protein